MAEGSRPAVADGSPPAVADGSPSAVADGSPPAVADGSPPAVADGSPPAVADGSPSAVAEAEAAPEPPFDTDAVALSWSRRPQEEAGQPPCAEPMEGPRFDELEELGRGAMGVVVRAWDRELEREVAVKRLLPHLTSSSAARDRFLREARIGALEHPNIVPVHELGRDADGAPFLVLRRLSGRSLREILDEEARGPAPGGEGWTRARLLRSFVQLCMAAAYAHSRGVLHRDIKPENVLIGDFGDVQLLDWGVGLRFEELRDPAFEPGVARGTPGYMAPELLGGEPIEHPERVDVYALGAVLYELLSGTRPWPDLDAEQTLEKTSLEDPPPPGRRAPWLTIPKDLEDACMAALSRDPRARLASARELAQRIEDALAGEREARRLRREADGKVLEAELWIQRLQGTRAQILSAEASARAERARLVPWSPVEAKRRAWAAEDRASALRAQQDEAFDGAHRTLLAAIERVPDHREARARLARLWWIRLEDDEERGDRRAARRSRAQVVLWDDGALAPALAPVGTISVSSDPPGAAVHCYRLLDVDRMLLPGEGRSLGAAPIPAQELGEGSHLLMLEAPGRLPTRLPLRVVRGGAQEVDVWLPPADALPPGMVHVPAGPALLGGGRGRGGYGVASARRERWMPGFALSVFPVTFSDYIEFLEALEVQDPAASQARWPRLPRSGPLVARREGRLEPAPAVLRSEDGGRPDAPGWGLPVVGVTWDDAAAYCAWSAARSGLALRLPEEDEWEKAGRGVDGRLFPWGPTYEPGFASHSDSSSGEPRLDPAGQRGMDESVYGVRDLQGGVAEWCAGWFDEEQGLRPARGSHWRTSGRRSLAERAGHDGGGRWDTVGFRVACTLDRPGVS